MLGFKSFKEVSNPLNNCLNEEDWAYEVQTIGVNGGGGKGGGGGTSSPVFVPPPAAPAATGAATLESAISPEEEDNRKKEALKTGAKSLQIPVSSNATTATVGTGTTP